MADITCLVLPHEGLLLTICMYSVNRADMGLKGGGADQFLIISSYLNFCKAPTSWVMLATWATLYRVFSVDSFSMMKLEARMPRCQKGFMSGSMWPWLSEGSLEFSVTSHLSSVLRSWWQHLCCQCLEEHRSTDSVEMSERNCCAKSDFQCWLGGTAVAWTVKPVLLDLPGKYCADIRVWLVLYFWYRASSWALMSILRSPSCEALTSGGCCPFPFGKKSSAEQVCVVWRS